MISNLLRDEETNESVKRNFGAFHGYMDVARDTLIAGRGARGAARERLRAAAGHALTFNTWRSLVREQGLSDARAAELMRALVISAGERQPAGSR
jgi:hypothetical protein